VEVEIAHKVFDRLDSYAVLKVPEVWRYRDGRLAMFRLRGETHQEIDRSEQIEPLTTSAMTRYIDMLDSVEENGVLREFISWLRRQDD